MKNTIDQNVLAEKLAAAIQWLNGAQHGDNCFVSNHYPGDPGDRCNCGKDSLLEYLESDAEQTSTAGSAKGGITTQPEPVNG